MEKRRIGMTHATDEKHLQQNAIDLLTRMGFTYTSPCWR